MHLVYCPHLSEFDAIRIMNPIAMARFPCLSVVLASTLSVSPAVSQDAQLEETYGDDDLVIEEIVVTGTRIKRRDFASPSPLVTVSREDLEFSGQPTLEEYLNKMPQMQPITGRAANNGSVGSMSLNKVKSRPRWAGIVFGSGAGFAFTAAPLSWSRRLLTDTARRGASAKPASSQVQVGHTMKLKRPTPVGAGPFYLVAGARFVR